MLWLRLLIAALCVLAYLRSPIDLIPEPIPGLGVLDDVLVLVGFLWWARAQLRHARPRPAPPKPTATNEVWNPYAVLGIPANASAKEITHAYREQMKRYHPDRVADLGEELQQLAHQKTVEIQRAYAELSRA